MKTLNKLSRFLGNEKARTQLLSGIVVALLTLTVITGFFVALPRQASAASTSTHTSACPYAIARGDAAYDSTNGYGYMFGGQNSSNALQSIIWKITPGWNGSGFPDFSITNTGDVLPHGLYMPGAEYCPVNGNFYIIGGGGSGSNKDSPYPDILAYNPSNGTVWDTGADLPIAVYSLYYSTVYDSVNNLIWIVGGKTGATSYTPAIQYYNISANSAHVVANLTDVSGGQQSGGTNLVFDGSHTLWALEGYNGASYDDELYEIDISNPDSPSITIHNDTGLARSANAWYNSSDDSILFFGGWDGSASDEIVKMNLTTFTPTVIGHLPVAYDAQGGFKSNHGYHFCGGIVSSSKTADAYSFWFEAGSSPSYPSAPTGATATAYTNFDISLSGLDANSRITFPTATVDDTTGDIVWANETSYGVLTVSNDGVQQINLSWTKGSGADKTVIRRDTTSHTTWTLSTGSLLANITDNYYNIGSLSPGTHYYFALWSWNSSGYSETYATCDAIVGNASVTNLTIHIEDVGSGTALVPKENFTLYGNATGSYAPLGAFDATTGNVTLTTSYAGLPLAIGDKLYFEFKAVVGAGAQPDGTYYDKNAQTLDCYVKADR